jgi:hypothetical protein
MAKEGGRRLITFLIFITIFIGLLIIGLLSPPAIKPMQMFVKIEFNGTEFAKAMEDAVKAAEGLKRAIGGVAIVKEAE